jgi:hypothetical protein
MKIEYKQLIFALFAILVAGGCGQSTGNSASNNTDSTNGNSKAPSEQTTENYCKKLGGSIFRYEDAFEDPPGKIDTTVFTIMFHCKGDSLNGMMLGVDPEGEEGVYYYKSSLKNIRINGDSVSFSLVQGDLFKKPFTVENYDKGFPNKKLGGSNNEHFYTGKIAADSIVLLCSSYTHDCFADTMVFHRKK